MKFKPSRLPSGGQVSKRGEFITDKMIDNVPLNKNGINRIILYLS
jgi:hypothetical protein